MLFCLGQYFTDFVVGPDGGGLFADAFPTKWNERANNINKQCDDIKLENGFQYGLCIGSTAPPPFLFSKNSHGINFDFQWWHQIAAIQNVYRKPYEHANHYILLTSSVVCLLWPPQKHETRKMRNATFMNWTKKLNVIYGHCHS